MIFCTVNIYYIINMAKEYPMASPLRPSYPHTRTVQYSSSIVSQYYYVILLNGRADFECRQYMRSHWLCPPKHVSVGQSRASETESKKESREALRKISECEEFVRLACLREG